MPLIAESVALLDQLGNPLMSARMRLNLGSVHMSRGDVVAAAQCYAQSLALSWSSRDQFARWIDAGGAQPKESC